MTFKCHICGSAMVLKEVNKEFIEKIFNKLDDEFIETFTKMFKKDVIILSLLNGYDFYLCNNRFCKNFMFNKKIEYRDKLSVEITKNLIELNEKGLLKFE